MPFSDLAAVVESDEFEDNGWIRLRSLDLKGDGLELKLMVRRPDRGDQDEMWCVSCEQALCYSVERPWDDWISLVSSHPLLWPYSEPSKALYFSQAPADPAAVVAGLLNAHEDITKGWFRFRRFVNTGLPIVSLLEAGHGQLATAPKRVCEKYFQVLLDHEMRPRMLSAEPAASAAAVSTQKEECLPKALLFGGSHVVGTGFDAVALV